MQGDLASIKDESTNNFLYTMYHGKAWIGARRKTANRTKFVWGDGSPVTYTSWLPGEPNNVAEGCVIFNWKPKQWIDASCQTPYNANAPPAFFCEMEPVSSNRPYSG